jgi:hypothetical protein
VHLRDRRVHFRIRDVFIPDPEKLLVALYGNDLLQGCVLELSDSGSEREAFAVVKVDGLEEPVIVPVKLIRGIL